MCHIKCLLYSEGDGLHSLCREHMNAATLQQRVAQRHNIPSIKEDMIRLVAMIAMKGVYSNCNLDPCRLERHTELL